MKTFVALALAVVLASGCTSSRRESGPLHRDEFDRGLGQWVVEQQPGGTVTTTDGRLVIDDRGGCTVWFRHRIEAPAIISYEVRMASLSRVSDLNCFWMATNPLNPGDLFAPGHGRTGKFETYDRLRTYYVGYGGNANTTTRFRRYDGTGARPLAREHDLSAKEFLLEPDRFYRIRIETDADGNVKFLRDGETIFEFRDPEPLRSGWFGFRTVQSRMEVMRFEVRRP